MQLGLKQANRRIACCVIACNWDWSMYNMHLWPLCIATTNPIGIQCMPEACNCAFKTWRNCNATPMTYLAHCHTHRHTHACINDTTKLLITNWYIDNCACAFHTVSFNDGSGIGIYADIHATQTDTQTYTQTCNTGHTRTHHTKQNCQMHANTCNLSPLLKLL